MPYRHKDFRPTQSQNEAWTKAYDYAKTYVGTGAIVVLIGKRGTGKTQLGTCLIGYACSNERLSRYVKSLDIFIELRESYKVEGKTEAGVIRDFVKPSLLVIDAIENRGETDFENRLMNHIIDKRYDNQVDTILISNQSSEEFATTMGPSIVSRIHETGAKIECTWESFRSKGKC